MSDTASVGLYGSCSLCGLEITEEESRYIHDQHVGWFPRRTRAKGVNAKGKVSRPTGAVAHGDCVDDRHRKQKAGIPAQQTGLF